MCSVSHNLDERCDAPGALQRTPVLRPSSAPRPHLVRTSSASRPRLVRASSAPRPRLVDERRRAAHGARAGGRCKVRSMQPDRFARLAALRGDVVEGIPVTAWASNLEGIDRDVLLRAVIETIRTLILPEWESKRPDDRRPRLALEATEAWLRAKTED